MDKFDERLFDMAKAESPEAPGELEARVKMSLASLPARAGRRIAMPVRIAAAATLAACALGGAALAASGGGMRLDILSVSGNKFDIPAEGEAGYVVAAAEGVLDERLLSAEARDFVKNCPEEMELSRYEDGSRVLAVSFEGFKEAGDFFGVALLGENRVLDASTPGRQLVRAQDGEVIAAGSCGGRVTCDGEGKIVTITLEGVFALPPECGEDSVLVSTALNTDRAEGGASLGYMLREEEYEAASVEAYTAANGWEWKIVPKGGELLSLHAEGPVLICVKVLPAAGSDGRGALSAVLNGFE